jgi:O-antigen ligase
MQRYLFYFLCFIVFWSPIPLGSHRIWSAALLELLIATLAILYLLNQPKEPLLNKTLSQNKIIIGLFWLIPLWSALQLVPLPPAFTALLSPHSVSYFPADTWHSLSLDSGATLYKLQKSIAYALFFTFALAIINTPERLSLVAQLVVISGVLQAVYGVLSVLGGEEFDIFHIHDARQSSTTGTFINRNHLAGYLEMSIAIGVGLLVNHIIQNNDNFAGFRASLRNFIFTLLSGKARLRVFLALMVVALVLSHSRMGNTAFFASLGFCGALGLVLYRKSHKAKSLAILFISLIAIDVLILGSWFGLDKLAARLETTDTQHEERTFVFQSSIHTLQDFWLTGSGAGSYYSIFPNYRDNQSYYFYDFAHNDFLQFGIEYGLIGCSFFALIVILCFRRAIQAQLQRRTAILKGMGFASMMGIMSIMIHSSTDFNLQIPANALLFTLLCAFACIAHSMEHQQHQKPKKRLKER